MAMKSEEIIRMFCYPASGEEVESIFEALGTYNRPELPEDGQSFHDWVTLVRWA